MRTILALVALCVVQYLGGIREDNFRSSYFNTLPKHRLAGHVIKTTTADSKLSCAHDCLAHDACKSCNFRTSGNKSETCELSSRALMSQTYDPALVHDDDFVFLYIENVSSPSTVQALKERAGSFKLFQTFRTSFGRSVTTFVINDELFLVYANGNANLPVYILQQNSFTINQTLNTSGAMDVEHFTIHGKHFLAVANHFRRNGGSKSLDSVVFRWEAGKLKEFQRIPTNGAIDVHYFTVDERKLLLISNHENNTISIYEWQNGSFSAKIQDIKITEPHRFDTFTIRNTTYIACGRSVSNRATTVMKWSGSQFESFQDLPSSQVWGRPHSYEANGTVYLVVANYFTTGNNYDTDSFIYRWSGTKFVHHQSIPTHGAMGWDSFTTAAGGVFLVVPNYIRESNTKHKVKSAVYKMADNKFNLYQKLPTTGAEYVHAFTYKERQYLAVVNHYDGNSHNLDSQVYIWN